MVVVPRTRLQTIEREVEQKIEQCLVQKNLVGEVPYLFLLRKRIWFTPHDIPTHKKRKDNYTTAWLIVNIKKQMKKHQFCDAHLSIDIWIFKWIIPIHPAPFQNLSGLFFSYVEYCMSNVHRSFCICFGLVPTPKKYLSLGRALIFHINLDIHPSKMVLKLVYYYLYHSEASFHLYICTQLFNSTLLILFCLSPQ